MQSQIQVALATLDGQFMALQGDFNTLGQIDGLFSDT